MQAKTYLRILQGGIIASLSIVFFVFPDLLFPYITSKQLSFNILMELLLVIWLIFIGRYPEYRPRRSYITWGLAAYFIAILASMAVSTDRILSFWGDAERMLGLFHLFHFFIFYLILITVFRSWKEWRVLLMISVTAALVVSLIGILGREAYSTIGNTAYVSGYLIFNLFFIVILFLRTRSGLRYLYILPALVMLKEFIACRTSGAIIGLFASLVFLCLLLGIFHEIKKYRLIFLGIFIGVLAATALIFSQQDTTWFQNSFLRNLTFQKSTFQTRLVSWRGAMVDLPNHWLFGTGFGNYAIIFDRQFDAKFFNYSRTETYFDRAHNNLIDIVSTTGLVGLLTYLSIFIAVIYYLWQRLSKNGRLATLKNYLGRSNLEILVIITLLAAYFIQNLAVFDSFVTYIGLMLTLGFVYYLQTGQGELAGNQEIKELTTEKRFVLSEKWEMSVLVFALFVVLIATNQFNLKPWRMFQGVIGGYGQIIQGELMTGVQSYQKALVGTPLDRDGRVTLVNLITMNPDDLNQLTPANAELVLKYAISLAEQNAAQSPLDSLTQMQLAQILDVAARYYYQDLTSFNEYSGRALQAMEYAIESSPNRTPTYLVKAQMQLFRGEKEAALETVNYAISLNPDYYEGYCRLAQFYLFLEDEQAVAAPLDKCLDLNGLIDVNSTSLLARFINHYAARLDYRRSLLVAERLVALIPEDADAKINLAKLYIASGDLATGEAKAQEAIILKPALKPEWDKFLQEVLLLQSKTATSTPSTIIGE